MNKRKRTTGVTKSRKKLTKNTQALARLTRQVRALEPELKSMDTIGTVQLNTTPVLTLLNGLVQGVENYQRLGKKIMMSSVRVKWNLFPTGNVNSGTDEVERVVLFWDASPNGIAPTMTQLLQDVSNAGTTSVNAYSGANIDYRSRFTILKDWFWSVPLSATFADSTGSMPNESASDEYYKKLGAGWDTHYIATTGAIASLGTGALYLLTTSNHASSFNAFALNIAVRVRYTDV